MRVVAVLFTETYLFVHTKVVENSWHLKHRNDTYLVTTLSEDFASVYLILMYLYMSSSQEKEKAILSVTQLKCFHFNDVSMNLHGDSNITYFAQFYIN